MAFITAETRSDLIELSVAMLKQAPSAALLEELIALSVGGGSLADAADHIAKTDAFKAEYPSFQTAEQYAAEIFDNITTGGTVTADIRTAVIELATGMLTSGSVTKAGLALAIAEYLAAPAALLNTDFADIAQSFQNRADAAEYFVVTKELGGSTAAELAAAIASVTSDAATLTAANTAADATASAEAVVAGQTFTLTTGVDAISGSAGNDTINGVVQANGGTGSTTSPGDVVSGGAGTDTFNLSVAGDGTNAGYTLQAVQLSAIENVMVTNFDLNATGSTTVDTALMTGVEKVGLGASSATGDTIFTGMTAIKDAQMANGSADLTLTYTAGTTGTADVQNLSLSAVSAGTFTASGVETIAVTNSNTANSLTNIAGSALKKITVTGDQKFTMTGSSSVATIDASENSGNTSLVIGAGTAGTTVSLGAGDDTIDIGATLTAADKIQGGAGTDTLKVETNGTLNGMASAADVTAEFAQTGGFENIEVAASGTATLNIENIAGVETVTANTNIRTITIASTGDGADADVWSFTINGTTYSAAAVTGSGDQAADEQEAAAAIALKINNDVPGATATAADGVVTVVNTSGGRLDISAVTDSVNTDDGTGTVNALAGLTVSGITTQSLDIYNAGSVTARLVDPSGDADVLNVNLKSALADSSAAQTVDTLNVADTIETLNLNATGMKTGLSAVQKTLTTLTADNSLTTLNLSGSDKLTIGTLTAGKLATINAADATGDVSLPGASSLAQTITMGSGNDTLIMAGNLTAADVIDMGGNTAVSAAGTLGVDTVTTSGNQGSTLAAAALQISNAEVVTVEQGASAIATYIDGSKLSNVGALAFSAGSGSVTLTNMPAGTAVGLGVGAVESKATYTVSLADATGTEDALSLVYGTGIDGANTNVIVTTGIETLNVKAPAVAAGNVTSTLTLTNMTASTINVTGGDASDTTALGTLNKATTAVYAGTNKGIVTFAASAGIAMDVTASAAVVNVIDLSTKSDTVTLSGLAGTIANDIDGGASTGVDTLNVTLNNAASNFANIGGFEVLNLTVPAATDAGFDATAKDQGLNSAALINILGGNSNSSFTVSTALFDTSRDATTALTVDASNFGGNIDLQFAKDALDIFTTVKGGALATDKVNTVIAAAASATTGNNPTMTGVETLTVTSTDADVDSAMSLAKVTGLTKLEAKFDSTTTADGMALTGLAAGVPVYVTQTKTADALTLGLASSTGSADALTVAMVGSAGTFDLNAAGIESLSLVAAGAGGTIDLAGVSPTTGAATTVTLSGASNFVLNAINTGINNINASGLAGSLTVAAAQRDADAITITGGVNSDAIAMENSADVLDGGSQGIGGSDTLTINYSAILGGITVDLSAADQVVTMDGSANAASQANFENVDLSSYANFGAVVTGSDVANTITGTAGADRIEAGKGDDVIIVDAGTNANSDQMNGGAGSDTLQIADGLTVTIDGDTDIVAVENISFTAAGVVVLTGQTEGFAITSSGTADKDNVVTGGSGNDTFTSTNTSDTDKFIFADTAANNGVDSILGFAAGTGLDILDFDAFLGTIGILEGIGAAGSGALAELTAGAAIGGTNIADKIFLVDTDTVTDVDGLKTLIVDSTANNALYLADGGKAVILHGDVADGAQTFSIYYVVGTAAAAADSESITLVGTVAFNDGDAIHVDNI